MNSWLTTVGLPVALGVVMLGLGLGLTIDDFRRVLTYPKLVLVALGCQLLLLLSRFSHVQLCATP